MKKPAAYEYDDDVSFHDTSQVGMTPLMLACRLGHDSMVEMIVDVFGAELDLADEVQI